MRTQRFLRFATVCIFAFLFIVSNASAQKMKVATPWAPPESCMMSESIKIYLDEITKRTNGQLTFEMFWSCSLGAPEELSDLVKSGAVQLAQFVPWYTPGKYILANFEYVTPFGPSDYELVVKAKRQIRKEFPLFAEEAAKQNAVLLFDPPGAEYEFLSKKRLRTVEDFNGEKVALIGRYFGKWLPPGASAVVRPGHERYDMLRSGVITVDLLPFDLSYAFKLHEVTKYFLETKLNTVLYGPLYMNLDTYNKLTPEIRKILLDTGQEFELKAAKEVNPRWRKKVLDDWRKAGLEFNVLSDAEKVKWCNSIKNDTALEWSQEMKGKGLPGAEIVKRWQEITEQLGYKWPRKWGAGAK